MAAHPQAAAGTRPAIVSLPAEIDIANARQVSARLAAACEGKPSSVIADMTGTTFCDSSGWSALLSASDRATQRGIALSVVITSPAVRRVFTILGLEPVLPLYPSLAAALTATSRPDQPARPPEQPRQH